MAVYPEFAWPSNPDGSPKLELVPNCETPDCEAKACSWAINPDFCYPCNLRVFGEGNMIQRYNQTHDETWEEAQRDDDYCPDCGAPESGCGCDLDESSEGK